MESSDLKTRGLRIIWGAFPWLIVVFILIFITTMLFAIRGKSQAIAKARIEAANQEIPAINVITLNLNPVELKDKINLPGSVEAVEDLWIKAEVSGQATQIAVDEGQFVKKGDVLIVLDDRDYRARLERIEANYHLLKKDVERYTILAEKEITAMKTLDEVQTRFKEICAQREEAELALSRTRIEAPLNGRINEMAPLIGDLIRVGDKIAHILDIDQVKVTVGIPESDVSAFFDLNEATVIIDALAGRQVTGKKVFLSYSPRSLARLYDLELLVPNSDGRILSGMFARVELVKAVYPDALVLPLYAVITENSDQYVFTEETGNARKRPVTTGIMSGWQIQILSGLTPGDRVIVVGHRQLRDDQRVEVIRNVDNAEEILSS